MNQSQARMLAILRSHAASDGVMPTNDDLCGALGCSSSGTPSKLLAQLEQMGAISVTSARNCRDVTVDGVTLRSAKDANPPRRGIKRRTLAEIDKDFQPIRILPTHATTTALLMGDPLPGRSALDRRAQP